MLDFYVIGHVDKKRMVETILADGYNNELLTVEDCHDYLNRVKAEYVEYVKDAQTREEMRRCQTSEVDRHG